MAERLIAALVTDSDSDSSETSSSDISLSESTVSELPPPSDTIELPESGGPQQQQQPVGGQQGEIGEQLLPPLQDQERPPARQEAEAAHRRFQADLPPPVDERRGPQEVEGQEQGQPQAPVAAGADHAPASVVAQPEGRADHPLQIENAAGAVAPTS